MKWLKAIAFGSGARLFALGSQFVVLIIISRLLDREAFGDFMIAFAFARLVSLGLGTGIGNLLLYHVARRSGDSATDVPLHRTGLILGFIASAVPAILVAIFAESIAQRVGKPGLATWLVHMAPFMVVSTLSLITVGSLEGRSKINRAILISEVVPNGLRLLLLPLVPFTGMPVEVVAWVMCVGLLVPWLAELAPLCTRGPCWFATIGLWELRYSLLYVASTIAGQQLQGLDMIVAGLFFTSEQAAGYALASRFASLYPFVQQLVLRNFAPRAGNLLGAGKIDQLNSELGTIKTWSLICVCGLIGGILIVAPFALDLFGRYRDALPLLVALAFPVVIRSIFAGTDAIMKMSGSAGLGFWVSYASAAFVVAVPVALHAELGLYSIPLGMVVSAVLINPPLARYIARRGIVVARLADAGFVAVAVAGLAAGLWITLPSIGAIVAGVMQLVVAGLALLFLRRSTASNPPVTPTSSPR